jgi:hypothetical protein
MQSAERKPDTQPAKQGPPKKDWTWIYNAVIELIAEIGLVAFCVYVVLSQHADNDDRTCFPSMNRLAAIVGITPRAARKAIALLKAKGLITIERRSEKGRGFISNRYKILAQSPRKPSERKDSRDRNVGSVGIGTEVPEASERKDSTHRNGETQELDPVELDPINQTQNISSASADYPAGLLELIDGWNSLGNRIVKPGNGARRDPPAEAVLSGWKRALKNREQRKHFQDIPAVLEKIKAAKYCHQQGWFTLPWLFGKNAKKEFNIERLMAGAHEGENYGQSKNGELAGPTRPHTRELTDHHYRA